MCKNQTSIVKTVACRQEKLSGVASPGAGRCQCRRIAHADDSALARVKDREIRADLGKFGSKYKSFI